MEKIQFLIFLQQLNDLNGKLYENTEKSLRVQAYQLFYFSEN